MGVWDHDGQPQDPDAQMPGCPSWAVAVESGPSPAGAWRGGGVVRTSGRPYPGSRSAKGVYWETTVGSKAMHLEASLRRISQCSGLARSASEASRGASEFQRLEDGELVALAGRGEVRALEALYDRYARAAFAFAVRIVGDPLEAEEILQEAFLRVWQQANRFQHARGSFASWLLSITHNLAIDALRRRQRRPQQADKVDFMDVLRAEVDSAVDLEEAAVVAELRRQVQAAMAQLPTRQRQVLELAYFQGLTQREIAELLDEPLGTVKTRMRLGLQKLQEALQAQRPETAGR